MENQQQLAEIFPHLPLETIEEAIARTSDLEEAAEALAQLPVSEDPFEQLTRQLDGKPKLTVYIKMEDLVDNAFSIYKSENFDPMRPLKIIFRRSII